MPNMTERLSILYRIIDVQADIIDRYKDIILKSHAEEELGMIELETKLNLVNALREKVGAP